MASVTATTFAPVLHAACLVALVAAAAGPLLAQCEILRPFVGFKLFVAASLAGLLLALVAGVQGWRSGWSASSYALPMAASVPGLLLLALFANGRQYPLLNDVSTDLDDPLELVLSGSPVPYPAAFAPQVREAYPGIRSIAIDRPPAEAYRLATELARTQPGWEVTSANEARLTVQGVARTGMFRFRDDFVIRVQPRPAGGSAIDMRSRSRDGRGDFGANAARIRGFLGILSGTR